MSSTCANAAGVLAGVVVAVFRGKREAFEDLEARLLEFLRAEADQGLEFAVVRGELPLQEPGLEQVVDPQEDLDAVEGLRDEVTGAQQEGPLADGGIAVAGDDEDRKELSGWRQRPDVFEHLEAVDPRHVEVEHEEVGQFGRQPAKGLTRVGRARGASVASRREQSRQERQVRRLIVNDQDARVREECEIHRGAAGSRGDTARPASR